MFIYSLLTWNEISIFIPHNVLGYMQAGGGNTWEQYKPEASGMLENDDDVRGVRQVLLAVSRLSTL